MNNSPINRMVVMLIVFLPVIFNSIWANGQNHPEGPLTPGYGLSNYFELTPQAAKISRRDRPANLNAGPSVKMVAVQQGKSWVVRITESFHGDEMRLRIVNMTGRSVYHKRKACRGGPTIFQFDATNLAPGIYVAELEARGDKLRMPLPILP